MVVRIVVGFGVEFLCCLHLMYVFIWVTEWPTSSPCEPNGSGELITNCRKMDET